MSCILTPCKPSISLESRLTRASQVWTSRTHAGLASMRKTITGSVVLGFCLTLVTAVVMYDVYWSFKTQDILHETEQNPLGCWLIALDNGDVALFMTCKMLGTMFVVMFVPCLYQFRKSWGMLAAVSLAVYQGLVFVYLNLGHLLNESI